MILVMLIAGKPFVPGAASAVVDALLVAEDPARGDPLDEKPSGRMASLPQLLSSLPRVRVAL